MGKCPLLTENIRCGNNLRGVETILLLAAPIAKSTCKADSDRRYFDAFNMELTIYGIVFLHAREQFYIKHFD